MQEDYKGFFDVCPIHEIEKHSTSIPYYVDWRGKGKEYVGNYFPCCGTICLKSTKSNFDSILKYRQKLRRTKPRKTNLWVAEALEGDTDIWRERGEIDAAYGFGTDKEGITPPYQVHEAITYLHSIDESIGETVLNQFFLAEPQSALWELEDLMASEKMIHDIRKHFNVDLFNLVYQQKKGEDYFKQSIEWLERNSLITPDPFRATKALFRLKAKLKNLPKNITFSYVNSIINHAKKAGFEVEEQEISSWLNELQVYGVGFDMSNRHPDYIP